MIDLRDAPVEDGSLESRFINQLREERIGFQFGELRNGNEKTPSIFILDNVAISFKPLTPTAQAILLSNKLKPQIWHESELGQWQDLGLNKQIQLHK